MHDRARRRRVCAERRIATGTSRAVSFRPDDASMAFGMATVKITITLEEEQVDEMRRLVEAGKAESVSGFVKHAVGVALDDVAGWKQMLDEALERTGGPLTTAERAWVDSVLGPVKPRRKKARA